MENFGGIELFCITLGLLLWFALAMSFFMSRWLMWSRGSFKTGSYLRLLGLCLGTEIRVSTQDVAF
jgi:hypothetical protein